MRKLIFLTFIILIESQLDCAPAEKSIQNNDTPDAGEPLFLTPFIENGQLEEARSQSKVNLIGAENVESYAGLITVNNQYYSNLFFWYFPTVNNQSKCVILWLNGGPGTSSMLGLFQENGPFMVTEALKLEPRQYTWTKMCDLLFIDNPVGTGYSFTENDAGYARNTSDCAVNLHEATKQIFTIYPHLHELDFYVMGESYGGQYVPELAYHIVENNMFPNFKGIGVGNGFIDIYIQYGGDYGELFYQWGLIDEKQKEAFQKQQSVCQASMKEYLNDFEKASVKNAIHECRKILDPFSNTTLFANYTGLAYTYNILAYTNPRKDTTIREQYLKLNSTRKAIHVGNITRFEQQAVIQQYLGGSGLLSSQIPHLGVLLNKGKSVLIYWGQLDGMLPYTIAEPLFKKIDFDQAAEYQNSERKKLLSNGTVYGYHKGAGKFHEVLVRDAGHQAPHDCPEVMFNLIQDFIEGRLSG